MTVNDEVLKVLPQDEAQAMNAGALFKICKWAADTKQVSTALSQLFTAGSISRKEFAQGQAKYVYWNQPAENKPVMADDNEVQASIKLDAAIADEKHKLKIEVASTPGSSSPSAINRLVNELIQVIYSPAIPSEELIEHLATGNTEDKVSALDIQVGGDHYKKLGIYQPWHVLDKWLTPAELKGFAKGTVIAYLAREEDKGGHMDIKKAAHTLQIYLDLVKDKSLQVQVAE